MVYEWHPNETGEFVFPAELVADLGFRPGDQFQVEAEVKGGVLIVHLPSSPAKAGVQQ